MLNTEGTIERLNDLLQLDIDAVHAYRQAIEKIDVSSVRDEAIKFQSDHERHVTELSALVRRLGGTPPDFSKDFKGYLLEAFTAMRSITGTKGALKALKSGEQLTNKKYDQARSEAISTDIMDLIHRNFNDEQKHLHYVEQAIKDRVWETTGAAR